MRVWVTETLEESQCHCFMFLEDMVLTSLPVVVSLYVGLNS